MMNVSGDINLSCQTVLLLFAVLLNILFIISTRCNRQKMLVATEVVQSCKTVQVMICLVAYVPIEVYALYSDGSLTTALCIFRDFLEKILMGLIPSGYLALAILRFKVWKCTGIASAIMKNKSAYTTLLMCSIVPITTALTSFILAISLQKDEHKYIPFNKCVWHSFAALRITTIVIVDIFPVLITVAMYWKLHREIKKRANNDVIRSTGRTTSMTKSILKDIEKSLLSFLIILVLTWIPYVILKCIIFLLDVNLFVKFKLPTLYVYSIILVCLCHPFAEGICLKHRRMKLRLAWNSMMKKNKIGLQPTEKSRDMSSLSTTDKVVPGYIPQRVLQTVVEEDSFKEEDDIEVSFPSITDSRISMMNFCEMDSESRIGDSPVEVIKENIKGNSHVVVCVNHHFSSSGSDNIKLPSVSNNKDYLSPNTFPNTIDTPICPNIKIQHLTSDDGSHTNIRCSQTSEPLRLLSTSSSSVIVSRNLSSLSDRDNISTVSMTSSTSITCNCRRCSKNRRLSIRSNRSNISETSGGSCRRQKLSRCSNKSSIPESLKRVSFTTCTDPEADVLSIMSDYF